jgi:acetylornithine aminotransferase/acetylornithine/N-succinyldiaminopimelate aminotransferase
MHGTTFGGGPLACAVAIAVIDTMRQQNLLAHVRDVGGYFLEQMQALAGRHDAIVDVRGMGLMLGIEMNSAELSKQVLEEMMARRIIINRTSETVLRFLPPYILERKHVNITVSALDEILKHATAGAVLAGEHANG